LTGSQQQSGYEQVSGTGTAGAPQATAYAAASQFMNAMLDPTAGGHADSVEDGASAYGDDDPPNYAATRKMTRAIREAYAAVTPRDRRADLVEHRWSTFATAYGGTSTINGDANAGTVSTTSRVFGTMAGLDRRFDRDTRVGFAIGGAGNSFSSDRGLGSGHADIFLVGTFARHSVGAAYVAGAFAYTWQDVTTDRYVYIAGTDHLRANFRATTWSGRIEAGYRIDAPPMAMTPYAALQATSFHLPGYNEAAVFGSNQFALSYSKQKDTNLRTELGVRGERAWPIGSGLFTLRGRVAWVHDTNTDLPVSATFQALPGSSSFVVNGAQPAADAVLIGAGGEFRWDHGWTFAAAFDGEFSQTTSSYAGKGSVRYRW
jgi:uncharacterized protein with beta-barrel porin domain